MGIALIGYAADAFSAFPELSNCLYDPEHPEPLNRLRGTLWEIHPVTAIDVWRDGMWVPLSIAAMPVAAAGADSR